MYNTNGLTIVMGDFNASIGESVKGVVGPHALEEAEMVVCSNTLFYHKCIRQQEMPCGMPPARSVNISLDRQANHCSRMKR